MKKGIEILKEVYFTNVKENVEIYGLEYSELYTYMQILIDYDKREIRTFLKSNWNSSYNKNIITKF